MTVMNVRLRHIRAFVALATEKSFVRAAERLGVSQPAMSQTILQFEASIGFSLFERTTRSLSLTKAGAALLDRAVAVIRQVDCLHDGIAAIRTSARNELRVGYLIGTGVEYIPEIVRAFRQRRPGATLALTEYDFSDPTAGLASGAVDCSIIRPPIDIAGLTIVEIARERCVACLPVGHRLGGAAQVTLAEILDEPFIAAPVPGRWRDYWLGGDHRTDRPARVTFEAATVESELQAVATDKGISITAESTAKFYARPGVVFRPIIDMPHCVIAIGHRDGANPLISDFIAVAQAVSDAHAGVAGSDA